MPDVANPRIRDQDSKILNDIVGREVPNLTLNDDNDPNLTRSYNNLQQTDGGPTIQ